MAEVIACEKERLDDAAFETGDNALFDTRQWANMPGGENVISLFINLAGKEYDAILEKFPNDPRVFFRKGCLAYRSVFMDKSLLEEKVTEATDWFKKAIENSDAEDANLAIIKGFRALVVSKAERWDEAIESLKEAIQVAKDNISHDREMNKTMMEVGYGTTLVDNVQFKEMLEGHLIQSLELGGRADEVKGMYLDRLKKVTEPDDPTPMFESNCEKYKKIIEDDEGRSNRGSWALASCAQSCEDMGKLKEAEAFYREALANDSGYTSRHSSIGMMTPSEFFALLHEGLGRVCYAQDNWEDGKLHSRIGRKTHPAEAAKYF
eukprot:TRINITY_DN3273_c0_g1_i1.p1 TRINITY_DN3273_c0_g1~~TRINITY_DN3273_c0_g1_i1.p1  ORF type:complete len:321 (-),score=93.25 TRINITY_DN3273_c0_g1_i1:24-986(-)